MTTVLVTGKDGQLAKCLKKLESAYYDIDFIFKSKSELDITDYTQLVDFFDKNNIDWCVNCAAYTNVDLAENEKEKAFLINEKGVENLSIFCNENNVKLVHISTDFVFDGKSRIPYSENSIPNPMSVYGISKLKGEQKIKEIITEYFIIRTSWLYSEHTNNFLKTMLRLSKTRDEIKVVNDQFGSPTYAGDLAEIIAHIIKNNIDKFGLYHYCNKGQTSWYDFAKEIFNLSGSGIEINPISSAQYKSTAIRPSYSVLDTSKLETILGLKISNWKTSLNKVIKKINE